MATWKSQPIFVSSTFADMQADRDHLRLAVFPPLEERLRARLSYDAGADVRGGPRRRERPPNRAEVLEALPGLPELRGGLRQARRGMTPPSTGFKHRGELAAQSAKPARLSAYSVSWTLPGIQFPQQQRSSRIHRSEVITESLF